MKILIIGRTSTGKDSLKDILTENYGWNFVKSMATRPPRTPDEDTHIFLTPEEAEKIPWENKAAWTQIGEYQYFATKQQIYDADAYIIDPKGAEMLLRNMPNEWFRIVYMKPADPETQMEMAIKRSDTPEKEIEVFNKRVQAEDDQFSEFEEHLANQDFNYPNCNMYIEFSNTYKKKDLEEFAIELEMSRRFDRNIRPIIEALMEADVMVVIGTSLNVYPAAGLLSYAPQEAELFLIDPDEAVGNTYRHVTHLQMGASEGMRRIVEML